MNDAIAALREARRKAGASVLTPEERTNLEAYLQDRQANGWTDADCQEYLDACKTEFDAPTAAGGLEAAAKFWKSETNRRRQRHEPLPRSVQSIAQPVSLFPGQGSAIAGGKELICVIEKVILKAENPEPAQPKPAAGEDDRPSPEQIQADLVYFANLAQRGRR